MTVTLTQEEELRLTRGLVDFSLAVPLLCVPFFVQRLSSPQVMWKNSRWFATRGFDVEETSTGPLIETWLIRKFGFAMRDRLDPEEYFTDEIGLAVADRYGGTGPVPHGGSGRVGNIGSFQVKGIGPTPLVGRDCDEHHAHGFAFFEEAIREAIYSEIAQSEFPHGAIPVIAIIDTGLTFTEQQGGRGERRVLIVRPSFFRLAHFQRAPMFFPRTGSVRDAQLTDVARVSSFVELFAGQTYREGRLISKWFECIGTKLVEQLAFGHVHRLFYGGFYTSNLTVDGMLCDYGSMRSVSNWAKVLPDRDARGFGDDLDVVKAGLASVLFYINKFVKRDCVIWTDLVEHLDSAYQRSFDRYLRELVGTIGRHDALGANYLAVDLKNYFFEQQKELVRTFAGDVSSSGWLFEETLQDNFGCASRFLLASCLKAGVTLRSAGAARALRSRPMLDREILQREIRQGLTADADGLSPSHGGIAEFIDLVVSTSRCHWRNIHSDVEIIAQVVKSYTWFLLCENRDGERFLRLEATKINGVVKVAGFSFLVSSLEKWRVDETNESWSGHFGHGNEYNSYEHSLEIFGLYIPLPRFDMHFGL